MSGMLHERSSPGLNFGMSVLAIAVVVGASFALGLGGFVATLAGQITGGVAYMVSDVVQNRRIDARRHART